MLLHVVCTDLIAIINKEGIGNNRFVVGLVSMLGGNFSNNVRENWESYPFTIPVKVNL